MHTPVSSAWADKTLSLRMKMLSHFEVRGFFSKLIVIGGSNFMQDSTVATSSYRCGSFLSSHIIQRYTTVDDCHSNVIDALQMTDSFVLPPINL
jgi:hypothetical protein